MSHLVIITGASSGIGAALAEVARLHGAITATTGRRKTTGDHARAFDLSDPASWPTVIEWWDELINAEPWQVVDLVHAAATLTPIGPAGEVDPVTYQANVLLNSAAPQVLGAGFLRIANRAGFGGRLVLLSSGAARTAYEGWSSYGAGKAAIDHWVRAAGAEQERRSVPIKVLSIAPGVVATAMQEEIRATSVDLLPTVARFEGLHRSRELADPETVAARLWDAMEDPGLGNGEVIDLRRR